MSHFISCVCPTHGRAFMLEEAVESFRRQTWPAEQRELLIVNDCPEQRLVCDEPGVRIINVEQMFDDLSEKFNQSVLWAKGDLVAWWEDDDISLPQRLEYSVDRLHYHDAGFFKQDRAWFWNFGKLSGPEGNLFYGSCIFDKAFFENTDGSRRGEFPDSTAHASFVRAGIEYGINVVAENPAPEDVYFVYRWGGMGHHESGVPGANDVRKVAFRQATLSDPRFRAGVVTLHPHWKSDYAADVRAELERRKA